jgi:hypothetical protein
MEEIKAEAGLKLDADIVRAAYSLLEEGTVLQDIVEST